MYIWREGVTNTMDNNYYYFGLHIFISHVFDLMSSLMWTRLVNNNITKNLILMYYINNKLLLLFPIIFGVSGTSKWQGKQSTDEVKPFGLICAFAIFTIILIEPLISKALPNINIKL